MKIVIAPDSFKGSLSAAGVCSAVAQGVHRAAPDAEIVEIPMADGGEGTVEALVASTKGRMIHTKVIGPIGDEIKSFYGILGEEAGLSDEGKTAVIEMAAAAGLPLVAEEKRNPLYTTTFGLGQLILHALDSGCREFVIGIGGSATNDCGTGLIGALGVRFFDKDENEITEPMTAERNGGVAAIDLSGLDGRIRQSRFIVACDVTNPLLGPNGASYTYGPQKGADANSVLLLEHNMTHIINLIERQTGRAVRDIPGAGAAGGLGAGLMAFLGASLQGGIEIVMRTCRFEHRIQNAHLIITGEGRIDTTTAHGKTIAGITAVAKRLGIPVIALTGVIEPDLDITRLNLKAVFPLCDGTVTRRQAIQNASQLLTQTAEKVIKYMETAKI